MFKLFKRLVCKIKGHDIIKQTYSYGIHEDIIIVESHCKRCGNDK
jgi:hypothetical protein